MISFEEVKRMVIESIEESNTVNDLIETVINKIYKKGVDDAKTVSSQKMYEPLKEHSETPLYPCMNCYRPFICSTQGCDKERQWREMYGH